MKHEFMGYKNRICLKPLDFSEIEDLRLLRNKHRACFVYNETIKQEEQLLWFEVYLRKENDVMFSVIHKATKNWIGAVALYNISRELMSAEFGRLLIDAGKTGEKGLGLEATQCACQIGFSSLGLKKIYLEVFEENPAAIRTYEKAGFSVVGTSLDPNGRKLFLMELHNIA